jgi:hypothetical protein
MAIVHLHIGLNKTGTSSLQDFFRMNAQALWDEAGLRYPRAGREDATAHHELSRWLKSPKGLDAGPDAPMVAALLTELAEARMAVVSSEDFHTHGQRSIDHLAALLRGHDVRVHLYLREHVAYLASWYQQNVQATHLSCAFDTFCFFTRKPLARVADQWVKAFGAGKVRVALYERSALIGGDIVQDFAQHIGLGGDLARFKRKPYESNPSVAGNLLFAKRLVNNLLSKPAAAGLVDEITALSKLKPEFRGRMAVDEATVRYVAGMYKADRDDLRQRYGLVVRPPDGALAGHATPDFATLQADWALVMDTARQRGLKLAECAGLVTVGDCSRLAPPGVEALVSQ